MYNGILNNIIPDKLCVNPLCLVSLWNGNINILDIKLCLLSTSGKSKPNIANGSSKCNKFEYINLQNKIYKNNIPNT